MNPYGVPILKDETKSLSFTYLLIIFTPFEMRVKYNNHLTIAESCISVCLFLY